MARKPVVIVTGASRGIGLAVVQRLLALNANVAALSRARSHELDALSSDNLLILECDITNESALIAAIKRVEETFQHIDGLVLNAGTLDPLCRIGDSTPLAAWKTHFDVNFFSLITAVGASLPALRASELGGKIIFVSSGAAVNGTPGWGPYSASKAALNSLCRTLAQEEPKITSIAFRPGVVDTAMQAQVRAPESQVHMSEADRNKFTRLHSQGELLSPDLPGQIIAGLVLNAPSSLNGQFVSWDAEACKPFRP
ncbi:NAD(P)-binding protein [Hymenopellis radicata]|nr:NAD(P)-binding protein [Hymenopellis radicata]